MGSYKLKFENGRCCTVEADSKPELISKIKEAEDRFSCACKEVGGNFIDVPNQSKSKRKPSTKSKEVIDAEKELKKAKSSKISSYIDDASTKLDEAYSKDKKFDTGGKSDSVPRWWNKQVRPYMFFVFNTETNKVWAGNEYQEDAKDELKEFLESNPNLPLKVFTKRAITNKKINPLAYENWARSTEQLDAIRKFALGGMMVANEVSNRLPATTSAIDKRIANRIYSERPSRWEDRGLRYADGGVSSRKAHFYINGIVKDEPKEHQKFFKEVYSEKDLIAYLKKYNSDKSILITKITRIFSNGKREDVSSRFLNKKFATGGTVGQEITFKHWTGDVRNGSITEDLGNGNFEVSSGFGSVLVNKNDIISGDKKFDTGGSTTDEFEDQMWWVSSRATKGKYTVMRGDYMHFFYSNKEDAIKKARQLNQIWKRK